MSGQNCVVFLRETKWIMSKARRFQYCKYAIVRKYNLTSYIIALPSCIMNLGDRETAGVETSTV